MALVANVVPGGSVPIGQHVVVDAASGVVESGRLLALDGDVATLETVQGATRRVRLHGKYFHDDSPAARVRAARLATSRSSSAG
jgi:hypothetical protein